MIIAYIGNFEPRTPRGEPFSTESHLSATLAELGHDVIRIQENRIPAEQVPRITKDVKADMLLWTKTGDWLRGDAWAMLKAVDCPSVSYHLDLFAPLPRGRDIASSAWWHTDYVFSADGDPESEAFFREHGVNHQWIPPGVFEPECYLASCEGYSHDVIFVGSGLNGYHPEWPYRASLLKWLTKTYGERFSVFGRGGVREFVRGAELNELYASTKIVIGDSLCYGFKHTNYWSDRIPETLGRGGFLIHPRISGLDYIENRHLVLYEYGNFDELKRLIDFYLHNHAEREAIRLCGHQYVKSNHTYRHRMSEMLEIVGT